VARWSPTSFRVFFLFLKNKIRCEIILPHKQGDKKLYI